MCPSTGRGVRPLLVVCAHGNCDDYFSGNFQVERSPSPFGKTPQDDLLLILLRLLLPLILNPNFETKLGW